MQEKNSFKRIDFAREVDGLYYLEANLKNSGDFSNCVAINSLSTRPICPSLLWNYRL